MIMRDKLDALSFGEEMMSFRRKRDLMTTGDG